jgi:hypothetical protein
MTIPQAIKVWMLLAPERANDQIDQTLTTECPTDQIHVPVTRAPSPILLFLLLTLQQLAQT